MSYETLGARVWLALGFFLYQYRYWYLGSTQSAILAATYCNLQSQSSQHLTNAMNVPSVNSQLPLPFHLQILFVKWLAVTVLCNQALMNITVGFAPSSSGVHYFALNLLVSLIFFGEKNKFLTDLYRNGRYVWFARIKTTSWSYLFYY